MTDHVCGGIAKAACQLIIEIGREHDVFCGLFPYLRLVFHNPVADGVFCLILNGILHFDELEHNLFQRSEFFVLLCLPLVKPDDDIAQSIVVFVKAENRVADNGEGDCNDAFQLFFVPCAKLL